jgi:hypothetical protein
MSTVECDTCVLLLFPGRVLQPCVMDNLSPVQCTESFQFHLM